MRSPSELTRRTASEAVSERLRTEIQRGDLPPGTRLRQGEVAARFGVSTTPVREAFALLQAQGLVRIDPHRGAIVFLPTAQDAQELYEIRIALETLAIGRAVKNLQPAEIDQLGAVLDEMNRIGTADGWADLHNRFHMLLYNGAGMPRLATTIANLRDASSSYINMFVAENEGMDLSNEGHREILDACLERNVKRAKKAVAQHLRVSADSLVASLGPVDAGSER
jgi:DNA-binding GntR family transcriptional regulator